MFFLERRLYDPESGVLLVFPTLLIKALTIVRVGHTRQGSNPLHDSFLKSIEVQFRAANCPFELDSETTLGRHVQPKAQNDPTEEGRE